MVRASHVERSRLVDRLAASSNFPITLLVAPAGYGKSVALRQYLERSSETCVRFTLRNEHSTLLSFLRGFSESLVETAPHAATTLAGAYERNRSSAKRAIELARWMYAHLESFSGIIAIDDLHIADADQEVARFVTSLIQQSKDHTRWILASRSTAGLPVGSWLAYRDADFPLDEQDLRFTLDEARLASAKLKLSIGDDELGELLELTEGWPVAMTFALRTSTRSADLRSVSAVTREMIYRFLAEQVYAALDDDERALLEVAMVLPRIDVGVLELAGFDRALPMLELLRERTAFLYEESPKIYQCHDLFRQFLRRQSALGGKRAQRAAHERAAAGLEASGDIEHAVGAYLIAASRANVLRLLEDYGFELLERARSDVVAGAIEALDEATQRGNGSILALRGTLCAIAGKFARAESLLRRSLAQACGNRSLVATTSLRLAAMMANQGQDVSVLLERVAEDPEQSAAFRAEAISLIAGQRAAAGDTKNAAKATSDAEEMLIDVESDIVRAKVLHRVGIAYHNLGKPSRAFEVLTQSKELSDDSHLFGLSSRVNAVLSNLVLHERDDVEEQLRYAEAAARAATKAGDTFALQTALLQMLSAEMRRGHVESAIAVEQRLSAMKSNRLVASYLTIFRSQRLAWEGRFGEAHRLLSSCWKDMTFSFDRASCGGEFALFLAIDGKRAESAELLKGVLESLRSADVTGRFATRATAITKALCALTEAINGRTSYAERLLRRVPSDDDEVIDAAARAVEGIIHRTLSGKRDGGRRLTELLARLRALDYGDLSALLTAVDCALSAAAAHVPQPSRLTKSEIEVLRLLDEGLVPKQIADRSARSVSTVRVHIANAIEKLGCHGHSEAIRTARRQRLI